MICMKCKWWKRNHICNTSYGTCSNDKFTMMRYFDNDDGMVFGSDVPLGNAWFETGALFGCVHFKDKS